MRSTRWTEPLLVVAILFSAPWGLAQKTPTSPADESRSPVAVRSVNSEGPDLKVPLCPAQFHDSLRGNGIAGPHETGVVPARVEKKIPAAITSDAIDSSNKAHIGNYIVIVGVVVDAKGVPGQVCLIKSSGYGLDASAASAASQYRFAPARKDGEPVAMRVPIEFRFANPEIGSAGRGESGTPAE